MVRKILPQALIHHASTNKCVTWNEKTPCTNTKTSSNSHTQKRQGEVKSPHPYFVIQIQQKQIAYSASCLRTAIRRFTLHNPTKTKKQLFRHEKIIMREHKALNKLLQRIASNQFHAKLPLDTHTNRMFLQPTSMSFQHEYGRQMSFSHECVSSTLGYAGTSSNSRRISLINNHTLALPPTSGPTCRSRPPTTNSTKHDSLLQAVISYLASPYGLQSIGNMNILLHDNVIGHVLWP